MIPAKITKVITQNVPIRTSFEPGKTTRYNSVTQSLTKLDIFEFILKIKKTAAPSNIGKPCLTISAGALPIWRES